MKSTIATLATVMFAEAAEWGNQQYYGSPYGGAYGSYGNHMYGAQSQYYPMPYGGRPSKPKPSRRQNSPKKF